jgi:FAD/FMN-containing dehydrogenase/Fe-S oxidoreductase
MHTLNTSQIKELLRTFEGEFHTDIATRICYATDASAYKELPLAIAYPRHREDLIAMVRFAASYKIPLIPRTAGTSLAGQVVGSGIVMDVSRHMNRILELNTDEKWVRVQPGVVPDELNLFLAPHRLFFAPETSTSNRCMIGGMVGNNSCGAHSLIYGSTRDHVLELDSILSDGSEATFNSISKETFNKKCEGDSLESRIYRNIRDILSQDQNRLEIVKEYPDPALHRRNTGYALDLLMNASPFCDSSEDFNMCRMLCGSEGTLAINASIKLNLIPSPPPVTALLCVHFKSLEEALQANLIALRHHPGSIELMDDVILKCTETNRSQAHNRFFIQGSPAAVLIIEWARDNAAEIEKLASECIREMHEAGYGYHFPLITGSDQKKVWALRKAGLGVLTNIPGDAKPTGLIEDTAVLPALLPQYIADFKAMLARHELSCVYYAHIATGELHLKPVLNLKTEKDHQLFRTVARETAMLVKKYRGSLSGEHGDGRLRGEFIPLMLGDRIYQLFCDIKNTWDPDQLFNPGKITSTPPMDSSLRYMPGQATPEIRTWFDYSEQQGFLRALEQCNGSADCRKRVSMGGTMCPSYMATGEESHSTRARTNLLREYLSGSELSKEISEEDVFDILSHCLSCKACKSECPSGIDMTRYKAEFMQSWYERHPMPLRTKAIAEISQIFRFFSPMAGLFNFYAQTDILAYPIKKILGIHPRRSFPLLTSKTLRHWVHHHPGNGKGKKILLFADEFTNFNDVETGIKTILLLRGLGYNPVLADLSESGRTYLSKGLLHKARSLAESNVINTMLEVNQDCPLVGIEPSAILCFRDEYPDLVRDEYREAAREIARYTYTFEEFIAHEFHLGNIENSQFTQEARTVVFHGHCYQKALTGTVDTLTVLSIPSGYTVREIASGCCGMAGSFGYEKEHYELSKKVGELVLFPAIRETEPGVIVVAAGTSCRHHIWDGTGVKALHPAEVLYDAFALQENCSL